MNLDFLPLVAHFMSSATVHIVGNALLVFIWPKFSKAFSTSSWLAEKKMTSFSSGSPWNLAEMSSLSRSHSCFLMIRISTEFPCLRTSSKNDKETNYCRCRNASSSHDLKKWRIKCLCLSQRLAACFSSRKWIRNVSLFFREIQEINSSS